MAGSRFSWIGTPAGRMIIAALALGLIAVPASLTQASDAFTDVPSSHIFHDDINAIFDAGVTTGCTAGKYCPSRNVTRGQMAAFLNRLGALSAEKTPVVNAALLNGWLTVSAPETFTLVDGAVSECVETTVGFEGDLLDDYQVTHVLYDAPGATVTSLVNVQLQEDTAAPADGVYDVCFSMIDGSNLPLGDYETHFIYSLFVGSFDFGAASAESGTSLSSTDPAPLRIAGREWLK